MKTYIVCLLITVCVAEKRDTNLPRAYQDPLDQLGCINDQDVGPAFHAAYFDFTIAVSKKAASRGDYFFTMSPLAVWITLAAVAEGADYTTQRDFFNLLKLPNNACSRQKFYQIATTRVSTTEYVNAGHSRTLVIDEFSRVNPQWYDLVRNYSLLQVVSVPLRYDPATTAEIIKQIISSDARGLDLTGNSVLLNSMDFNGLWTTAFADAVILRSPFYSRAGVRIGSVDLMRVKRRVRIGYVPSINSKIIELPVGLGGEYSMIFALVVNNNDPSVVPALRSLTNITIYEIIASLQDSYTPIDVALPRFVITSEINMKEILEDFGIHNLWNDPVATRYISTPAAQPSSYIHRATLTLSNEGINPAPYQNPWYSHLNTGSSEDQYWREFIADRPFMFGLFDTETYTCLMSCMFTKPTYPY